jgi:hypothetical protein
MEQLLRDRTDGEFNFQHLIDFQSSRLRLCFGYVFLEKGVPRQKSRKLPPLPPTGHPLHQQLKDEAAVDIACGG